MVMGLLGALIGGRGMALRRVRCGIDVCTCDRMDVLTCWVLSRTDLGMEKLTSEGLVGLRVTIPPWERCEGGDVMMFAFNGSVTCVFSMALVASVHS